MAKRILVVDDEPTAVDLLAHSLADGYELILANSGLDALHKARRLLPDLIVLDLMLPDLDGLSVCEILRRQPSTSKIPIVLLTALAGEASRLNGPVGGAAECMVKPFSPLDLAGRIRQILEADPVDCAPDPAEDDFVRR
jgi:DNA-binding response OmpR family regulator